MKSQISTILSSKPKPTTTKINETEYQNKLFDS